MSAEAVEVVPKIGSTRTPVDWTVPVIGPYELMFPKKLGAVTLVIPIVTLAATSPIGPVLEMPWATHCLLMIEPPSPRRSIV